MGLSHALRALEHESSELLDVALAFPALITRKRSRKVAFEQEKATLKEQALNRQRDEEDRLRKIRAQQAAGDDTRLPTDRVEAEEKLQNSIAMLKTQLFDASVELQQLEKLLERIYLSKVVMAEAAAEAAAATTVNADPKHESNAGFLERDRLATRVLKLARDCKLAAEEESRLKRRVLKRQIQTREKWASKVRGKTEASEPDNEDTVHGLSGKRETEEETRFRHHNAWLRHVLTTMALEAKVNWAADPELRAVIMGEPIL